MTICEALSTRSSMLLIAPGVYLWGMWQLWIVVMVVEGCGPLAALARSWQLSRGSWWHSVTLVTVIAILSMLPVMLILLIVPWLILPLGLSDAQALIANLIGLGLASILVLPLVPAALVAVYLFLCGRSGGSAVEAG